MDVRYHNNIKWLGEIFFRFRAKLRWKKKRVSLCSANAWIGTHTTFPVIPKWCCHFFGSKFSVRVCNTSDVHTGQTFTISWSKIQLLWMLMLYYPYKTMFSAYKSVMCLQFVCKQSDENHSVHGCPFLVVIFQRFFSVWWLYFEINHSLVAEIICTIYSFIHASTQHNISNENSFQECFIFNWSA